MACGVGVGCRVVALGARRLQRGAKQAPRNNIESGRSNMSSGVRKRVVSKRVVLADVPLYRNFLQKVFPCSTALVEERYDY